VAFDPQVREDRLWHDKYSLRTEMIPSFLSLDQAKKVLLLLQLLVVLVVVYYNCYYDYCCCCGCSCYF